MECHNNMNLVRPKLGIKRIWIHESYMKEKHFTFSNYLKKQWFWVNEVEGDKEIKRPTIKVGEL